MNLINCLELNLPSDRLCQHLFVGNVWLIPMGLVVGYSWRITVLDLGLGPIKP